MHVIWGSSPVNFREHSWLSLSETAYFIYILSNNTVKLRASVRVKLYLLLSDIYQAKTHLQ